MITETFQPAITEMQTQILTKVSQDQATDQAAAARKWNEEQAHWKAEREAANKAAEERFNKSHAAWMKETRETRKSDLARFKILEEKKEGTIQRRTSKAKKKESKANKT